MKKTLAWVLTLLLCIIVLVPSFSYANDINPNDFNDIYKNEGTNKLQNAGGQILGVVKVIGVSAGVICLLILGVKYMIMSSNAESKATIKEKLIPYVIGTVLLFGGTWLLSIIADFAKNMNN